MAKYRFQHVEEHQVTCTSTLDFDTSDKQLWADLLLEARVDDPSRFPADPPDDVDLWFELLQSAPPHLIDEEPAQDWWTARKGGYEQSDYLMTPEEEIVRSAEY